MILISSPDYPAPEHRIIRPTGLSGPESTGLSGPAAAQKLRFFLPRNLSAVLMALLSPGAWLEERGQRDNLFHSKVLVQDRGCALTIDHWSSINAISLEMVENPNLPTTLHPQPYTLPWCPDLLLVKYQTKVQCSIGPFFFEVLCDVVPKYLDRKSVV